MWQLERRANGKWLSHSSHVSCDAAKTRARNISGWYSNPEWRIATPAGETCVTGRKRNGKMKWIYAEV